MTQPRYVIGYDVGGTKLGIGLASTDGKLLGSAMLPNKDTYPEDVLPETLRISKQLLADAGLTTADLAAFGISSPYPADPVNGIMTAPTNNKFWRNVPIRKYFEDNLGIAGTFENDANCAALAEWFFGAGRGCKDFIFLTMSTGIGAGIIAADKLVRGKGYFAGELGHMVVKPDGRYCNCGLRGCYEAYCGGRAIALHLQSELRKMPDNIMVKMVNGNLEDIDMIVFEKAVRAGLGVSVDWDKVTKDTTGSFKITSGGQSVTVNVSARVIDVPADIHEKAAFVLDGEVAVVADNYTDKGASADGTQWQVLENYGKTGATLKMFPVYTDD